MTIPHFETQAMDHLTLSKAKQIAPAPNAPASLWKEHEVCTQQHQEWIQRGWDHECRHNLCCERQKKEEHDFDCSHLHRENKEEPPQQGTEGSSLLLEDKDNTRHVVNREGFSILNEATPMQLFNWTHAPTTHRAIPDDDCDLSENVLHVPIWQTCPTLRNSFVMGNNPIKVPSFVALIQASQNNLGATAVSDIFDNFLLFGNAQTVNVNVDPPDQAQSNNEPTAVWSESGSAQLSKQILSLIHI